MVSNALNMDLNDLIDCLRRIKRQFGHNAEYQNLRKGLPEDWPM
jgi:hypothetical protein